FIILSLPSITLFPYTTLFRSYDSVISMMGIIAAIPFMNNKIPTRSGASHPHRVPSNNFKTSDGSYIHVICNNQQWEHLCDVLQLDRKSTRLNSSHVSISYAVF